MQGTAISQVGSIVRAPRPSHNGSSICTTSRALVATVSSEDDTVSLLFENPTPLPRCTSSTTRSFIVTPDFSKVDDGIQMDSEEATLSTSLIQPLLPFETDHNENSMEERTSKIYKERGDALLRLRDPSAAAEQYEAALSLTSNIELGGTVILNRKGHPTLAEVDCIEKNDAETTLDVTFVRGSGGGGEEEATVSDADVLLALMEGDSSERMQERILLNLTRCLLQLANLDALYGRSDSRSSKYRRGAVLGSTLAMTCSSYHNDNSKVSNTTEEKARFLRAKAYAELGKIKHAYADLRKILHSNEDNKEASNLFADVKRKELQKKKTDRKLAKEMCAWVQGATYCANDDTAGDEALLVSDDEDDNIKRPIKRKEIDQTKKHLGMNDSAHSLSNTHTQHPAQSQNFGMIMPPLVIFIAIVMKYWLL